jgi:hypothetical protein
MKRRAGPVAHILTALTAILAVPLPVAAQEAPAVYAPARTPWGDPDLRGTWPVQNIWDARIPLERPASYGGRELQTDEEFAARLEAAKRSDGSFADEMRNTGTVGLARWLQSTPFGRRTSLIVSPADGRLPPLTQAAAALNEAGRSSWKNGQAVDWLSDLDAFDRCITRGFPALMLPNPYNDGLRVFQSPGYVVIQLETFGTRIIPVGTPDRWHPALRGWLGSSRGHWEGDTLVIETTNIVAGDSATRDMSKRAGAPVPGRDKATIPMSVEARTLERLTMAGPDTIAYEVTYTDPEVFTAPWTAAFEWTRDESYTIYEYACHEGHDSIRTLIQTTRKLRNEAAAQGSGR